MVLQKLQQCKIAREDSRQRRDRETSDIHEGLQRQMKTLAGTELWPAQEDRTTPEYERKNARNSETSCPTPRKLPPLPSRFKVRKPIASIAPSFQTLEESIIGNKTAEEMVKQISGKQNQIQQEIPAQENPFSKPSHLLDAENLQIKIPKGYVRVVPDTGIETVS